MAMNLLLYVSFCHSTFLSHIGGNWTGLIGVYATMVSLKAYDTRPPSLTRGTKIRKLWGPPLTTVGCGLWCIRPFLRTLSLLLGTPEFFFLKFPLLEECLIEWDLRKHLYPLRLSWWGFDLWVLLSKRAFVVWIPHLHIFIPKSDFTQLL